MNKFINPMSRWNLVWLLMALLFSMELIIFGCQSPQAPTDKARVECESCSNPGNFYEPKKLPDICPCGSRRI